jgi:magnesium chelatase subunit I
VELAMTEETGEEDRLFMRIVEEACKNVFDQYVSPKQFRSVVEHFETGQRLTVADSAATNDLLDGLTSIRGFQKQIELTATDLAPDLNSAETAPGLRAAVAELILDGLYAHNRINKATKTGAAQYGM